MEKYDHKKIEDRWSQRWKKSKLYRTSEDKAKPKYYILDMFPYPSGSGLHVGHPKGYIATDIFARVKMMQGYNVLHPMGWDAFGLPAENYAIANKIHPRAATEKNIKTFKNQLGKLGFTYDWEREINTSDPEYYKWTQWIFIKMFERGLAYESNEPVNWCPSCKTVLSNEDLENGRCERCDSEVERKPMRQWVLKITDYADRLLNDLEKLPNWEESIKEMQRNWIGRSEGAEVEFRIKNYESKIKVFTTRPDTLFGATFMVISPEHKLIGGLKERIKNFPEVEKYIKAAKNKSDLERTDLNKEKTGVKLEGVAAINPVNNEEIPIFVADYVLIGYGTGAIMAVPAHDQRDWEFAKRYGLKIIEVVGGGEDVQKKVFVDDGVSVNSDFINGLETEAAKEKMIKWLEEKKLGKLAVNYKLKDWIFSRQRYWGEPIPVIHCERCIKLKPKLLLIHGLGSQPEENWFPWLKAEMEKKGYEVLAPSLPKADNPEVKAWMKELKSLKLNDGSPIYILGHSLGAAAACRFIAEAKIKVKKLILVAPVGSKMDLSKIKKQDFSEDEISVIKNFSDDLNFSTVKKLVAQTVLYISPDDPYIPMAVKDSYKDLNPKINILPGKAHFSGGMKEFPEILEEFSENLNLGIYPVPEKDLPLKLPEVKNYQPTGTGESPLANIKNWVKTTCPNCGGPARRETNTMPNWAGSSWYYLRYIDPKNKKALVDKAKEKYWSPVDFYVGGAEHATRHLIYARFWHKFLFDIGAVNYDEPFRRFEQVGLIMAEDGRKMSKRWGNVINPDEIVEKFGADSLRVYEMFMGPFNQPCAWSTNGVIGARRFLENVYKLKDKKLYDCQGGDCEIKESGLPKLLHKTIKKVTQDIEDFHYNTAISAMMIFVNFAGKLDAIPRGALENFLKILVPFAPHLCEELWSELGNPSAKVGTGKESIFKQPWPKYNLELVKDEIINLVIQINGKVRDTFEVSADISEKEAKKVALASEKIKKWLEGKEVKKIIFVKGKLVNIVI